MLSKQEAFNKVYVHLLTQNAKAAVGDPGYMECIYRDDETGRMCAVGCLIPDKLYNEKLEGKGYEYLCINYADDEDIIPIFRLFENINRELLNTLQATHDSYRLDSWEDRFEYLAKRFELEMPK